MNLLAQLLSALGRNAVPVAGVLAESWTTPAALVLYWAESLIGALFNLARIAIHRARTRKRGHYRAQLGVRVGGGGRPGDSGRPLKTFLAEYAVGAFVFSGAHGLFLALILLGVFHTAIDGRAIGLGIATLAGFELVAFVADLPGIAERPFSWIRRRAQYSLGRVVLLQLVIIVGGGIAVFTESLNFFFYLFAGLKLLSDLAMAWNRGEEKELPERPPAWASAMMKKTHPGESPDAWWDKERRQQSEAKRRDEEALPA
ncbi:MAG: DUF6498-containing protein [Thermoanaerobaculia bacterium]